MDRMTFMEAFRSSRLNEELTSDDCLEIFLGILKGSSDITAELLLQLFSDYSVTNIDIMATLHSSSGNYTLEYGTDPHIGDVIDFYSHEREAYLFKFHSRPKPTYFFNPYFEMDVDLEEELCGQSTPLKRRVAILKDWLENIAEDPV